MSKKFLSLSILSLFVTPALALAAPKVGDFARMEGTMTENQTSFALTAIQKITAFDGKNFTIEQTQIVGSQSKTTTISAAESDVLSEETAAQIIAACSSGMGKRETVRVKAGKFDTCKTESDGSTIWMAVAPFGVVKIQTKTPNGKVAIELVSFGRGT